MRFIGSSQPGPCHLPQHTPISKKLKEDVDEENNTLVLFQKLKTILVLSAFKDEVSTSLLLLGVLLAAVRQCLTV